MRTPTPPLAPVGLVVGTGVDKKGRTITVRWEADFGRPRGGFVEHRATAWHNDACLGYLRLDGVTPQAYALHNPTVWNHIARFHGASILATTAPIPAR